MKISKESTAKHDGVDAVGAGAEQDGGAQDVAGDDSPPTVLLLHAVAVDDIEFFALAREADELLGVDLAVGVDLKDIWNLPTAGFAVAYEAAFSVALAGLIENLEARPELLAQSREDLRGAVDRAIIERQEDEVLGPIFHCVEPFERNFTDRGLIVVDRHDDHDFGGHGRDGQRS